MASTYSPLKIELVTTGEQSGTWGTTTNVNLGTAIEEAITGSADVTFASANVTLTLTNTNGTQTARNLRLRLTGTTAGARNLIVPAIEKQYIVQNDTADTITIKNATGTGVAIPSTMSAIVYNNGTNITSASIYSTAIVTPVLAATDAAFVNPLAVTSGGTGVITSTGSGANVLSTSPTLTSPTLTGSPIAPTQTAGTNNTTVATTAFTTTAIANALQVVYPVGSIYSSTVATNPGTLFGFGTWVAFGAGRVMIGNGGGFSAGATGGSADAVVVSHNHTASSSSSSSSSSSVSDPGHQHTYTAHLNIGASGPVSLDDRMPLQTNNTSTATTGISVSTSTSTSTSTTVNSAGVSGTNANLQPYVVVYMWNRTA
jgi:hypothetical protein